jgi:F420-dependent oxidoreductase-like protein
MHIGLFFRPQGYSIDLMRDVWRMADEAGFDHLWACDHLVAIGPDPDQPLFEAWTSLAAMAALTSRVRIGLQVSGNLYRHPGLLAKIAVTVDHLSNGRLEMAIGAAWNEPEFRMLGMHFPGTRERIERLDEACTVLKALWTEDRASFDGCYYTLDAAACEPKPIQQPHPPLWVGGSGPKRTLRVVARHADVWSASGSLEADIESSRILNEHCAAIGRDPTEIRRSATVRWADDRHGGPLRVVTDMSSDIQTTCSMAEQYAEAGFEELIIQINAAQPDALRVVEASAFEVLPRLRSLGD